MTTTVTDEEVGKTVIDANGDRIGEVERVQEGTALVEPRPGINPTVTGALGWFDDPEVFPLRPPSIDVITPSTIRLRSNL